MLDYFRSLGLGDHCKVLFDECLTIVAFGDLCKSMFVRSLYFLFFGFLRLHWTLGVLSVRCIVLFSLFFWMGFGGFRLTSFTSGVWDLGSLPSTSG